ncbi:MAG: helix-turn-helix transcriptional regulator [Actinomycetales bacterium]
MEIESSFKRLRRISDFIFQSNSRDQVISFLSANVCPFGEISGVGSAVLSGDGVISVLSRYGFSNTIHQPPDVKINADHPAAEAFRSLTMQIVKLVGIKSNYQDINSKIIESGEYKVGIWIPISSSKRYGFALSSELESIEAYREYFLCIGSLLSHWENINNFNERENRNTESIIDKPITERQRRIIELIKEGRTNSSIASILGYSESLIRQETIVIYRKLGINGRNDLIDHPRGDSQSF